MERALGSHLIISENPDYAPSYNLDTFSSGFETSESQFNNSQEEISVTESHLDRISLKESQTPEERQLLHGICDNNQNNNLVYDKQKWTYLISDSEQKSNILSDSQVISDSNTSSDNSYTSTTFQMEIKPLLAGTAGGILSTLLLHPLDNIKIRCAAGQGTCINHFRSIRSGPEGFKGFYRGMSPNLGLSAFSWATYFFTYESSKRRLMSISGEISSLCQALAALEAGIITMILSNPLQVLRTRMVLSSSKSGTAATVNSILQREGLGALFRGFSPNLVGVAHGTLQFSLYDAMKRRYKMMMLKEDLVAREHLVLAAGSKMLASLATYPCQVVRTVMQDEHVGQTPTARQVVRDIVHQQGVRGLYRGLLPHLLHVTPNVCIIFTVYEAVLKL